MFNRNGLKFVRNEAGVSNLTTFHCVYIKDASLFASVNIDLLFAYLLTDMAKEIFSDNKREYGNGLNKFEPNDLNKANIVNLSILENKVVSEILFLYQEYRRTKNQSNIDQINEIFISEYSFNKKETLRRKLLKLKKSVA